jgi:death-on-curing family protein
MPNTALTIEDVRGVVFAYAQQELTATEPIPPFDTRYPGRLESCLAAPFQAFGGQDLYPDLTDKAAALFYFMVKNRPFKNGNKRLALISTIFLLLKNGRWLAADQQQLYSHTVWMAESLPEHKDAVIMATRDFIKRRLQPLAPTPPTGP